ncbi:MAG: sigma-70 family RNA polymerase sigma factor [Alphaproteobacteria bacterium]|nr:sigma-70 family RNA polymerase sigma factor [Alphaproteobacteria bacterium]
MSKIPQGEWSAIAARYAKGESISRIAQSYGCTPPAIHYILKRSRQRSAQNPESRMNGIQDPVASQLGAANGPALPTPAALPRSGLPHNVEHAIKGGAPVESEQAAVRPIEHRPAREPSGPTPGQPSQPAPIRQAAVPARALAGGLDSELHGRAEAAIAAFRSSFDDALAEGSPIVRQRLRQAAADLMRVAARTTIVLDRLNAMAEREPARMPDRWGWNEGR